MWSWFHNSHLLVGCPVNIAQHCQMIKQSNRPAVLNSCVDMRGATGRKRKHAKEACELHIHVLFVWHRQGFWKLVWLFLQSKKNLNVNKLHHTELRYWWRNVDFIVRQSFVLSQFLIRTAEEHWPYVCTRVQEHSAVCYLNNAKWPTPRRGIFDMVFQMFYQP
jgi:hypothetical protein